jgi:hypothetical protein
MNKTALNEKIQEKPFVNKKLFDKKNQEVKHHDTASYNKQIQQKKNLMLNL